MELSSPASTASIDGLNVTASTGTLTIANAKTLTANNTITLTATDGSTLAIGTGGTLGTAAYVAIASYATLASPTFTGTVTLPTLSQSGLNTVYNNVTTAGWGHPAIYGYGRPAAGQTGDVASVATYTCGAADGSFIVSCNANCTAFTAGVMAVQCAYTDEGNVARTLVLSTSNITGTIGTNFATTGAFEGLPLHIRVKASTAITVKTVGTAWTGTYNVEGVIQQIA